MSTVVMQCDTPVHIGEVNINPKVYRCHLAIVRDSESSYSAVVLNLPGAGGCGDTENGAIVSAQESVVAMAESYVDDGVEIPWIGPSLVDIDIPEGAKLMWVLVNG